MLTLSLVKLMKNGFNFYQSLISIKYVIFKFKILQIIMHTNCYGEYSTGSTAQKTTLEC